MTPFDWVSEEGRGPLLLVLTALLLVLSAALAIIGEPLITAAAPGGIVSFELAGTLQRANEITRSWSPGAREHAMLSLGLDYLYLVVYPAWLSLACLFATRRQGGRIARLGSGACWAVLLCGPLDALENYALIGLLGPGGSDALARTACACAVPKFALVLAATLTLVAAGSLALWRRLARRGRATSGAN